MRISLVTPSYRNSEWLKLCIASVADQGVDAEHIIQDNCSDDGTLDWLRTDKRVQLFVEKDSGMYDAINRGIRRATGDLLMYLNCDEQLLPGALQAVVDHFKAHPHLEVLFANTVVVDENGDYICSRKAQIPSPNHIKVAKLPTFTCATFFRRSVVQEKQLFFETRWRTISDATWVLRVLDLRLHCGILHQFTSTFTDRPGNLGTGNIAQNERAALFRMAPTWAQRFRPVLIGAYRVRRLLSGAYSHKPFHYAIYTRQNPKDRTVHYVKTPTGIYHNRLTAS